MTIPKFTVVQYVRNKKRVPYGVLVAVKNGNGFNFGYSLCNKKDRFTKEEALDIALERACAGVPVDLSAAPHDIRRSADAFFERCGRYYKVS
jgi:hypothetical protein